MKAGWARDTSWAWFSWDRDRGRPTFGESVNLCRRGEEAGVEPTELLRGFRALEDPRNDFLENFFAREKGKMPLEVLGGLTLITRSSKGAWTSYIWRCAVCETRGLG
jgi:hypothetical protein